MRSARSPICWRKACCSSAPPRISGAARAADDPLDLYRALRPFARVQERLYPLAPAFAPVSRWFLDPARRVDDGLVERLRDGALRDDDTARRVGILHAENERD